MTLDAMDEHEAVFELVLPHYTGIQGVKLSDYFNSCRML